MSGDVLDHGDDHLTSGPQGIQIARWMVVVGVVVTLLALAQLFALITYQEAVGQRSPAARTVSATRPVTADGSSRVSA
jgi:hypothetical protein